MKTKILLTILSLLTFFTAACSHTEYRTKFSDAQMQVGIDPGTMDVEHYTALQESFLKDGRFLIIDRFKALQVLKDEQHVENRGNERERFDPGLRYAEWGKLHGLGSVVIPSWSCIKLEKTLFIFGSSSTCTLRLSIVNAATGQVVAIANDVISGGKGDPVSWDNAVEKLGDNYPKIFEDDKRTKRLIEYQNQLRQESAVFDSSKVEIIKTNVPSF